MWTPPAGAAVLGGRSVSVIVSLAEAEALRHLIESGRWKGSEVALVSMDHQILAATHGFLSRSNSLDEPFRDAVDARFFNNEMGFKDLTDPGRADDEIAPPPIHRLLTALSTSKQQSRDDFFHATLASRRRGRTTYYPGAAVRFVFIFRDLKALVRLDTALKRLMSKTADDATTVMELCETIHTEEDLKRELSRLDSAFADPEVTHGLFKLIDVDNSGRVDCDKFVRFFESCHQLLLGRSADPVSVTLVTLTGERHMMRCRLTDTIATVRRYVHAHLRIPQPEQRLMVKNSEVKEGTLEDNGVKAGTVLRVLVAPSVAGGGAQGTWARPRADIPEEDPSRLSLWPVG